MLARENLMVYWDEQNGYNDTMQEDQGSGEAPATAGGEFEGGTSYVAMMVTITGLKNVDASSEYVYPGLWSFIDSATGDAVVTVDDASGTFTPAE